MVELEVEVVLLSLELAGGGVLLPLAVGAGVAPLFWLAPLAAAELESDAEAAWDWTGVAKGAGLCGGLGGCAVGAGAGAGILASSKSANDCVSVPCTIVDICCHCDDGIEGVAPTSDAILDT